MVRTARGACSRARLAAPVLALLVAAPAVAERGSWGHGSGDDDWKPQYSIGPRTAERLSSARQYIVEEDYEKAEATLGKLRLRSMNPLEKARTHQIRAYIAAGREDFAAAREQLEAALDQEALDAVEAADVRYQIAQLWMQEENWERAAKSFETWFTMVEDPNPSAHYVLALCYYQQDQLDRALEPARAAVAEAEKPREEWLKLLLAILLTREDYRQAVPVLEELVARFPRKSYWLSLSTVHGTLGEYDEALPPLQVAYAQGLLTEDAELRRLAQLLLHQGQPFEAAKVIQKGLEDGIVEPDARAWELVANGWVAARHLDRAVEPLRKAAELSDTGELFVRLAQVHVQHEDWTKAEEALRRAMDKGGLENPGDAQLLMGIASYSRNRPHQARRWFARARQHATTREAAATWIDYIDKELASS